MYCIVLNLDVCLGDLDLVGQAADLSRHLAADSSRQGTLGVVLLFGVWKNCDFDQGCLHSHFLFPDNHFDNGDPRIQNTLPLDHFFPSPCLPLFPLALIFLCPLIFLLLWCFDIPPACALFCHI